MGCFRFPYFFKPSDLTFNLFFFAIGIGLLTLLPGAASAQCNFVVRGRVVDALSGSALAGAAVHIAGMTQTDSTGVFRRGFLCAGTYVLRIEQAGYRTREDTLVVADDLWLELLLQPLTQDLDEIIVEGTRPTHRSLLPSETISGIALDAVRGESLGHSLRHIVGVSVLQSGPSIAKPAIHGLTGNRIVIVQNDIRLEGQQWGFEHAPEVDPFVAEKITVVKGAATVLYGSDAMAGVILLKPEELPDSAAWGGRLHLVGMTNNREGVVSAQIQQRLSALPLAWRVQGTFKRAAAARTPHYFLSNTGYSENNFSMAAGWKQSRWSSELFFSHFQTRLGIFSGSHLHNLTDLNWALQQAIPNDTVDTGYQIGRPYQRVRHELFKAKVAWQSREHSKIMLTAASQFNLRDEFDKHPPRNDSLAVAARPELGFRLQTHSADLVWQHRPWNRWHGQVGLSSIVQNHTYSGRYFIPYYDNFSLGLFALQTRSVSFGEIQAGLRYDYRWLQVKTYEDTLLVKPRYSYQRLTVSGSLAWHLNAYMDLHVTAATGWRPPAVHELYSRGLHHGVAALEYGNTSLKPEYVWNAVASMDVHDHTHLNGEVSVHYSYIRHFIYLKPQPPPALTIQGAFPVFVYDQTHASVMGLDAAVDIRLGKQLRWEHRFALLYQYDLVRCEPMVLMPPPEIRTALRWESTELPGIDYGFVAINVTHTFEQKWFPTNSDYLPPPPAFTLFGAEAGIHLPWGHQQVRMSVSGFNLTNAVYRNYMNRFRYFADEMGRNILFRLVLQFGKGKHSG